MCQLYQPVYLPSSVPTSNHSPHRCAVPGWVSRGKLSRGAAAMEFGWEQSQHIAGWQMIVRVNLLPVFVSCRTKKWAGLLPSWQARLKVIRTTTWTKADGWVNNKSAHKKTWTQNLLNETRNTWNCFCLLCPRRSTGLKPGGWRCHVESVRQAIQCVQFFSRMQTRFAWKVVPPVVLISRVTASHGKYNFIMFYPISQHPNSEFN